MSSSSGQEISSGPLRTTNEATASGLVHPCVPLSSSGVIVGNESTLVPPPPLVSSRKAGVGAKGLESSNHPCTELNQLLYDSTSSLCLSNVFCLPEKRSRRAPERFVVGSGAKPSSDEEEEEEEEEEHQAKKSKKDSLVRQKRKRIPSRSSSPTSSCEDNSSDDSQSSTEEDDEEEDEDDEDDDENDDESASSDSVVSARAAKKKKKLRESFRCPVCRIVNYAMCSRRGIRKHVMKCTINKFKLSQGSTYDEVCSLLSQHYSRERLNGFMFRPHKQKRRNQDLPFSQRWYCPNENRGCGIFFLNSSTASKRRHQIICKFKKAPVKLTQKQMEDRKEYLRRKWDKINMKSSHAKEKSQEEIEQESEITNALLALDTTVRRTRVPKNAMVTESEKPEATPLNKKTVASAPRLPKTNAQLAADKRAKRAVGAELEKRPSATTEFTAAKKMAAAKPKDEEMDKPKTTPSQQVTNVVSKTQWTPLQVASASPPAAIVLKKKGRRKAVSASKNHTSAAAAVVSKQKEEQSSEEVLPLAVVTPRFKSSAAARVGLEVVLPNGNGALFQRSPIALVAAAATQRSPLLHMAGQHHLLPHSGMPYSFLPLEDSTISPALSSLGYQSTLSSHSTAFLHPLQHTCCPAAAAHAITHVRLPSSVHEMTSQFYSPLVESRLHGSSFACSQMPQSGRFIPALLPPPAPVTFNATESRKRKQPSLAIESHDPSASSLPPSQSSAEAAAACLSLETPQPKRSKLQPSPATSDELTLTTPQSHARTVSSSDGTLQFHGSRPSTNVEAAAAATTPHAPTSATPIWAEAGDSMSVFAPDFMVSHDVAEESSVTDRKKAPASRFHSSLASGMLGQDTLSPRPLRSAASIPNGMTTRSRSVYLEENSHRSSPKLMSLNRTATSSVGFMPRTPESSRSFHPALIHPDLENTRLPESSMSVIASESDFGRNTVASMGRSVMRMESIGHGMADQHSSLQALMYRRQQQQQAPVLPSAIFNTSFSSSCSPATAAAAAVDQEDSEMKIMDTVDLISRHQLLKDPSVRLHILQKLVFDP